MIKISTIGFAQLRNAEHVSFLNNVCVTIEKIGAEILGLTQAQLNAFKKTVDEEQYGVLMLHMEYKSNMEPESEMGEACASVVAVVNQLIKDVKHNLALRLGKGGAEEE